MKSFSIKEKITVLLTLWAAAILVYCYIVPPAFAYEEEISQMLRDPSSAQFRGVHYSDTMDNVICGEVNAKNGFGAYGGYTPFYVEDGVPHIVSEYGTIEYEYYQNYCN